MDFRWETIGNFIHQHMESSNRSAKEVLMKAKELQKMGGWSRVLLAFVGWGIKELVTFDVTI